MDAGTNRWTIRPGLTGRSGDAGQSLHPVFVGAFETHCPPGVMGMPAITAEDTFHARHSVFSKQPGHAGASVTASDGSGFAHHHKIADTLGVPTYFYDLYHSCAGELMNISTVASVVIRRSAPGLMISPRETSMSMWQESTTSPGQSWAG